MSQLCATTPGLQSQGGPLIQRRIGEARAARADRRGTTAMARSTNLSGVGCRRPWPSSPPGVGRRRVGGGHNGLACAAYLARAGRRCSCSNAANGSAAPARWSSRSTTRLRGQPVRVRGRTARSAGDRRARARRQATRCTSPTRTCGARSRTARRTPSVDHERRAAADRENGFSDADIKGSSPTRSCSAASARRCAKEPATPGSATRRTATSWKSCWPRPRDHRGAVRGVDRGRRRALRHRREAAAPRSTARASSAPGPGRGPRHRVDQADALPGHPRRRARRGATSRAAWAGCRSRSAEAAREAGVVLAAGVPVAEILPGEGVVLEGGELSAPGPSSRTPTQVAGRLPRRRHAPAFTERLAAGGRRARCSRSTAGCPRLPALDGGPDAEWPNRATVRSRRRWTTQAASRPAPAASRARVRRAVLPDRVRPDASRRRASTR